RPGFGTVVPLGSQPLGVLLPVVLAVLAGLDRLPPRAVVAIPLDGLGQAVVERAPRRPAERPQLGVVQRVAAVVTRAGVDVADEARVGAGQLEDPLRDREVLVLLPADVVDLARPAPAEDEL